MKTKCGIYYRVSTDSQELADQKNRLLILEIPGNAKAEGAEGIVDVWVELDTNR
jgi:DNA invertase Pin-like site-specific DNA recombinase